MKLYETYKSEKIRYQDRVSGVGVWQLTSYLGHSHHKYFTNNGWWDDGKRLLFSSDRKNATNLFSIEIESGEISRLTDFQAREENPADFINDVNPKRPEVYYIRAGAVYALDLLTLEIRKIYEAPEGFELHGGLSGADGKSVYIVLMEDLSKRIHINLGASYVGMRDIFRAKPDCRIIRVDVDSKKADEIWQEYCWVGHVNPSPTKTNLLTFCHEGPWGMVDHRIWLLDTDKGTPVRLRERRVEGEKIGHEYWFAEGEKIGYQVHEPDGTSRFGCVRYDGSDKREAPCVPFPSPDHIHSNDFNLIVSDSGKSIKLYRYNGKNFDSAKVLCMHDGSFYYGSHHPHPRFTADGKSILFNSTVSGYCNLYLVDIPEDVTKLPEVEK